MRVVRKLPDFFLVVILGSGGSYEPDLYQLLKT
jgi:hypothetical protein